MVKFSLITFIVKSPFIYLFFSNFHLSRSGSAQGSLFVVRAMLEVCHCPLVSHEVSQLDFLSKPGKTGENILHGRQRFFAFFSLRVKALNSDKLVYSCSSCTNVLSTWVACSFFMSYYSCCLCFRVISSWRTWFGKQ